MQAFVFLASLLACLVAAVSATALTFELTPNEKACFFAHTEQKGLKMAFYFAVSYQLYANLSIWGIFELITNLQVQSGGAFDVDYKVTGPNEKIVLEGWKERQGDFVFTANEPGEYRFCFDNEMSTISDKMVDFEIAVGSSAILNLHTGASRRLACEVGKVMDADDPSQRNRLRTSNERSSPPNKARPLNRRLPLRSPSTKSRHSSRRSRATRNTSGQERTGILALSGAQKGEYSISASSRVL